MIIKRPRICVVGLGEIGASVFSELLKHRDKFELIGVDVDTNKFDTTLGDVTFTTEPIAAEYYIVCVWTMDQIMTVLEQIAPFHRDMHCIISIESTIDLSRFEELMHTVYSYNMTNHVVTFPHRYNPNDPEHGVFNQPRVLGGITAYSTKLAKEFYSHFMRPELIHETEFYVAAMSKVAENAYRAMEIILAQELQKSCASVGIPFQLLREAMNTKWNIDVREVHDGVKGKCLPKDLAFFCRAFPENVAARVLQGLNKEFVEEVANNRIIGAKT